MTMVNMMIGTIDNWDRNLELSIDMILRININQRSSEVGVLMLENTLNIKISLYQIILYNY